MPPPPIIDCHCHAGKGDGLTGPWDTNAPLTDYLRRADQAGITRTVLLAAFHTDNRVANAEVARIVASRPDRFFGMVFVNAERDRGRIFEMVREGVERHGFIGIKVHRHDARLSREICETARAFAIPILYDPVGEVTTVELAAAEYPDVAFIIPHMGSFSDDWRAQSRMIDYLVRFPNVHADTSGVRRFDLLAEAVHRAGAGKILFGTDGPWLHPAVELAKITALELSPRDEQLVIGRNLLRLIARRRVPATARAPRARTAVPAEAVSAEYRDPWLHRAGGD